MGQRWSTCSELDVLANITLLWREQEGGSHQEAALAVNTKEYKP